MTTNKTFDIDGMTVHYGLPEEAEVGIYFYLPYEKMTKELINKCKRVDGYVGIYQLMEDYHESSAQVD